ncbi:MAG: PrsW family intramembrane metalloprotease [Actinomycetota bacterium]
MIAPDPGAARAPRAGWGRHTSIFQTREPAFLVFAVLLAVCGFYAWQEQQLFAEISASGWVLSWLLLLVYALPLFLAISLLDLYEREPMSLVVGALLWGGIAATVLSALANQGWGIVVARLGGPEFAARWTAALTAPLVEEIAKAAGVVLIYLIARREMDDVIDGFVYGAMAGLGFAVVEDVFYFVAIFGGTPAGVLAGFYVRVVSSGLYGHVLYTGLSGMGIAYFVSRVDEESLGRRLLVAAALFLSGVAGHFLWNSPLLNLFPGSVEDAGDWLRIPLAAAVKGLPLLVFVVVLVRLAHRREHRWLEASLRSEVDSPALTRTELGILLDPGARRRSRRDMRARGGERAARLLRRLQREQVNLAMVRTRVGSDEDVELVRQRALCKSLRDALLAIPGAAPAGPADPPPPSGRADPPPG